jgi:hypothetical protein
MSLIALVAVALSGCSDSTGPGGALADVYLLATVDGHAMPYLYFTDNSVPATPRQYEYTTRLFARMSADTFVVEDYKRSYHLTGSAQDQIATDCVSHSGRLRRSGANVIFSYYVSSGSVSVGGPLPGGPTVILTEKADTLLAYPDSLVEFRLVAGNTKSRLVYHRFAPTPPLTLHCAPE